MKTTNLRIGNLVYNVASGSKEVCEVESITKLGITYDSESGKGICVAKNIRGIKLDVEWLARLTSLDGLGGFSKWVKSIEIEFRYDGKKCWIGQDEFKIIYVHQLQNLYFGLALKELKVKKK